MGTTIAAIAWYTWLEALRNRLVWVVLACLVGSYAIVAFLAHIALTETVPLASAMLFPAGATFATRSCRSSIPSASK